MGKVKACFVLGAVSAALLLAFNNCNKVGFDKTAESIAGDEVAPLSDSGHSVNDSGTDVTHEQEQEIIGRLPPEEVNNPRPITDLETDPTLYERYKCLDSDGVVICHFPENVDAQGTKCVGRPAVSTHYDHIRTYSRDGTQKSIGDYLGPCRVAL